MKEKIDSKRTSKKQLPIGWIVLLGPLSIVILLTIFEFFGGPEWIDKQSDKGALYEAITHNELGLVAMRRDDIQQAYGHFKTALGIKADYAEPYANIGLLFYTTGNYDQALQYFNQALELNPLKGELIYNNMGMVYGMRQEYETALSMFYKALELDVRSVAILRNIGRINLSIRNYEKAAEYYQRAIENRPTVRLLYMDMLQETKHSHIEGDYIFAVEKQLSEGVSDEFLAAYDEQIIEEFSMIDPRLAEDYRLYAQSLSALERNDDAIDAYYKSVSINPNVPETHNRLGILLAKSGDISNALTHFETAVKLNPLYEEARHNMEQARRGLQE